MTFLVLLQLLITVYVLFPWILASAWVPPRTGLISLSSPTKFVGAKRKYPKKASCEILAHRHELHWLEEYEEDDDVTLGQSIADGEVVLCLPKAATDEECESLLQAAQAAVYRRDSDFDDGYDTNGQPVARSRFSVADPAAFSSDVVQQCEQILLRIMDYLDEHVPSIYDTLFWPASETWCDWQPLDAAGNERTVPPQADLADRADSLRELYEQGELEWSEGEPAINLYSGELGGAFGPHKDHLALTVLIPLTSPDVNFGGGGTGYWAGNADTLEDPEGREADVVLKPEAGSALVFGGDVTHAGMPVNSGVRSVFVCSFSTRTSASPADRLHGLKAAPVTSANFKGT